MKYLTGIFFTGLLVCTVFVNSSQAQAPARVPAREEPIWQQLQKIAPKAVDTFKAATVAMDQKKYPDAAKLYRDVLRQAPDFDAALRRLSFCLIAMGQRDEGLKASKKALDLNRSADNLMGYAINLSGAETGSYQATPGEFIQALGYAKEARQKNTDPSDPDYAVTVAELALAANNTEEFDASVQILTTQYPNAPATHYFNGIRLANSGDLSGGEAEINRATALGMPAEATEPVLAAIAKARSESGPTVESFAPGGNYAGLGKYFYYGFILVLAWALGLLALLVAGKVLSAKTFRAIETEDPNDITGARHAGLRKLYRYVISIAGVYYYLSQPVVMLLVIVATLGIIVACLWAGYIPIKLLIIVAFVGGASIFYMVKSLFVRIKAEDPGRALSEEEAPGLWAAAREVAAAVDTRPVNEIRLTWGTDLAVYERGSMRLKLMDQAERILIVGLAVINDFDQNAFRAVLAHEYGHFSHRDTAGGDVANRVNQHILRLAAAMARGGTATVYNIAFQFLRLFHFIFRRITRGATRLQEVLADRVAVYQYGAAAFRDGLTHVIRREIEFAHLAENEIKASQMDRRALQNLYELSVESEALKGRLDEKVAAAIVRPTSEDDTHPSPHDRFLYAARITPRPRFPVTGQVWDLFRDREALTNEMNKLIEQRIRAAR